MRNKDIIFAIFTLPLFFLPPSFGADLVRIEVDIDKPTGKFFPKDFLGVYQTPLYPLDTLLRSIPLLKELGIKNIRYELGWGKPDALGWDAVDGSLAHLEFDFSKLDPFYRALKANGIQPLFAITYCPKPLQSREGWEAWKDPPCSLKAWSYVCEKFAQHIKRFGLNGIYEIWNEPDLGHDGWKNFFYGDTQTYRAVYESAVEGILKGDPDSKVGGAGVAWNQAFNQAILRSSKRVDFISIHAYGKEALRRHLDWAKGLLQEENKKAPIYLTEYSSFSEFGLNAPVSRYQASSAFFRDIKTMLEYYPLLEKVYWAQWVDDALGLLTHDLHRKALYNAFFIYQRLLPEKEVSASSEQKGVGVLAGREKKEIGAVIWNEEGEEKRLVVHIKGRLFRGRLLVYRIDEKHGSFVDNPKSEKLESVEEKEISELDGVRWTGELPPYATVYLHLIGK